MADTRDVALISGAAGALGAEVARVLAARGMKVGLLDSAHNEDRLRELAASIGAGAASVSTGDLATEVAWTEGIARIERELGAPPSAAALIAGTWRGGRPLHQETSDETWRTLLSANLETAYRGLRACLPAMVGRGHGSIVVVGSRAVEQPSTSAGSAAYAATKSAVVALAQAAAAEVVESGVRINAILPSTLDTPANRAAMPHADPTRWVSLASAAGVVAFLLGSESRDIHGAAIPVYAKA